MILVTLIVFVIVLVLLTRANHRLIAKRKCSLNLQDALILVHGAICQQSKCKLFILLRYYLFSRRV